MESFGIAARTSGQHRLFPLLVYEGEESPYPRVARLHLGRVFAKRLFVEGDVLHGAYREYDDRLRRVHGRRPLRVFAVASTDGITAEPQWLCDILDEARSAARLEEWEEAVVDEALADGSGAAVAAGVVRPDGAAAVRHCSRS